MISKGARVAVFTVKGLGRVQAAHLRVACVFCAGVIVVTDLNLATADALGAEVTKGAGVAIITSRPFKGFVDAARFGVADVVCAGVVVVTEGLIGLAVTVIIDAVTDLF